MAGRPINRWVHIQATGMVVGLCLLLMTAASGPATAAANMASDFHPCGSVPELTSWSIKAKRVSCKTAKDVVAGYVAKASTENSGSVQVRSFSCKISGYYGDGYYVRCAASNGSREIRFARGG